MEQEEIIEEVQYHKHYIKILQNFCDILNINERSKREYFINCKDSYVLEKEIISQKSIVDEKIFYYCAGIAFEITSFEIASDLYEDEAVEKFENLIGLKANEKDKKEVRCVLIGYFEKYKGYTGTIEYNLKDKTHRGRLLNCNVSYEGKDILELERDFHDTVERYLELCGNLNLETN